MNEADTDRVLAGAFVVVVILLLANRWMAAATDEPAWREVDHMCADWFLATNPETVLDRDEILFGCRKYIAVHGQPVDW